MKACCAEVYYTAQQAFFTLKEFIFLYFFFLENKIPGIMKIVRDGTGSATSLQGISAEMLDWMIRAYNFTYNIYCAKTIGSYYF